MQAGKMEMGNKAVNNRRYFPRVKFRAYGTLTDVGGTKWPIHILDLSFNGALAALIHKNDLSVGEQLVLHIGAENGNGQILKMQGRLSHCKQHFLGIECRAGGIDNQTLLREILKESQQKELDLAERSYSSMLKDYESTQ